MRTHQTGTTFRNNNNNNNDWQRISIIAQTSKDSAYTKLNFHNSMTDSLDISYDAGLFKTENKLSIYTRLVKDNGIDFSIQSLPARDITSKQIDLGLNIIANENITFSAVSENFSHPIYLYDKQEETYTNLKEHSLNTLVSQSGHDRFEIRFSPPLVTSNMTRKIENPISCYHNNEQLIVLNPEQEVGTIHIFDILGQKLMDFKLSNIPKQTFPLPIGYNYYIIEIQTQSTNYSTKVYGTK